jgi:hypothetical protein
MERAVCRLPKTATPQRHAIAKSFNLSCLKIRTARRGAPSDIGLSPFQHRATRPEMMRERKNRQVAFALAD